MTDQTIPADKVREITTAMRDAVRREGDDHRGVEFLDEMLGYIAELAALLPAPPRPTLADMTEEERVACQWMQADVAGRDTRYVILGPYDVDDDVVLISDGGGLVYVDPALVTSRPDLPRLEWPDDKPAPVPPNTLTLGSKWDDAAALTEAVRESGCDQIIVTHSDNSASVWDRRREDWSTPYPIQKYAPFTIIHTGR